MALPTEFPESLTENEAKFIFNEFAAVSQQARMCADYENPAGTERFEVRHHPIGSGFVTRNPLNLLSFILVQALSGSECRSSLRFRRELERGRPIGDGVR